MGKTLHDEVMLADRDQEGHADLPEHVRSRHPANESERHRSGRRWVATEDGADDRPEMLRDR